MADDSAGIFIGSGGGQPLSLLLRLANRHGPELRIARTTDTVEGPSTAAKTWAPFSFRNVTSSSRTSVLSSPTTTRRPDRLRAPA